MWITVISWKLFGYQALHYNANVIFSFFPPLWFSEGNYSMYKITVMVPLLNIERKSDTNMYLCAKKYW